MAELRVSKIGIVKKEYPDKTKEEIQKIVDDFNAEQKKKRRNNNI